MHLPMGFAAEWSGMHRKEQVHKSRNTFGEPDDLFDDPHGERRSRAAESCGVQPLGNVGAHFG